MPLTSKGEKIKSNMQEEYGPKKGESVFYASANKGTITGVHGDDLKTGEPGQPRGTVVDQPAPPAPPAKPAAAAPPAPAGRPAPPGPQPAKPPAFTKPGQPPAGGPPPPVAAPAAPAAPKGPPMPSPMPAMDAPEGGSKMVGPAGMTIGEIARKNHDYWKQWGAHSDTSVRDVPGEVPSELPQTGDPAGRK